MKTALILYVLTMTSPAGDSYVMDSHLTLQDCGTAIATGYDWYVETNGESGDWTRLVPVMPGATFVCEVM